MTEEVPEEKPKASPKSKAKKGSGKEVTCNYCKDPKCPRMKGDLKSTCIHYEELKED